MQKKLSKLRFEDCINGVGFRSLGFWVWDLGGWELGF